MSSPLAQLSSFWHEAPLVRFVVPFILGIISAVYLHYFSSYLFLMPPVLFVIICMALYKEIYVRYTYRWLFGIMLSLFLFLCGYQLTFLHTEKYNPHHFSQYVNQTNEAIIKIIEPIRVKTKTVSAVAEITQIKNNHQWQPASGKVLLYLNNDSNSSTLTYGDELAIYGNFQETSPPKNPAEFDYKQYLAFHAIYHQAYIKSQDWKLVSRNQANIIFQYSYNVQNYLVELFSRSGIKDQELAVVSALVLGARENIDPELVHAYTSTGALHVLSVSGLHVGLIYIVLGYMFFFFKNIKHGAKIKAVVLLLSLWAYAFITGLPPSVARASAMFSFIIIGQSFNRQTNIYNTLAASALLQLLFDPYILMDVGFQLSYIAVISIVWLQPRIYNSIYTTNWLLDKIWALTSVSLAAQLITFPLGLLYFHQFPNYFLLSNLVVIPISTAVIYAAIGLLVLSPFQTISLWIGKLLNILLWLLNSSVMWIEKFPYSLIEGISISIFQTWLIYAVIISGILFFSLKNRIALYSLLISITILISSEITEKYSQLYQQKLIVYNIANESAIDLIDGEHGVLLASNKLLQNEAKLLFHIKHNWWDLGLTNIDTLAFPMTHVSYSDNAIFIKNNFIQLGNKKMMVLENSEIASPIQIAKPIFVDCLILSKNVKISIHKLSQSIKFIRLIFDSSNSNYTTKRWKAECEELNIAYYDVKLQGAYVESSL